MISTDIAAPSVLIPLLRALEKSLSKHDDDTGVQTMKSEVLSSLKQRFANVEECKELVVATTMDPRYQDKFFSKPATKVLAKELITEMCTKYIVDNNHDNGPPNKKQHTDDLPHFS